MSPAATLDDDTARAAVLRSADAVFYARGVAGVGMADIRDDSGVSLRRLYGLYPSKSDLVAAWLTARHTTWMEWFAGATERLRGAGGGAAARDVRRARRVGRLARLPGLRLRQHRGRDDRDRRHPPADHRRPQGGSL